MLRHDSTPVVLWALEHGCWEDIQARLHAAMLARRLGPWVAPTVRILHDLLDDALRHMHLAVFRQILENEAGLSFEGGNEQIEPLYHSELGEHGASNIANACRLAGQAVSVVIPEATSLELALITAPLRLPEQPSGKLRLIEALGYRLATEPAGSGCRLVLSCLGGMTAPRPPRLLEAADEMAGLTAIKSQLGYGLIQFSPAGHVLAASPALLERLQMATTDHPLAALGEAIPAVFRDDVLWGLALADDSGLFENYRIRLKSAGSVPVSILFNVSGFRAADGVIHSLWQVVSQADGGTLLSQGSMLSEVRVSNITRNYVPQLVELKAREAVRLGKTSLSNEQRPVAVLFCDIVGFTAYVEGNATQESTIDTLNTILRRISGAVKHNRGHIDKFMGDSIMALFDDPADALKAAIGMQSHSEDINSLRSWAGQQVLQLRIGIHWGEVVIGNVGTPERLDWTAIGDVVNTASRIEKGCEPGGILVSEALQRAVEATHPRRFEFGPVTGLQVKGKRDALRVCSVSPLMTL